MADQALNPNYIYHSITTALANKTPAQRYFLKANALNQAVQGFLPFTYTLRGVTITVTEINIVGGDMLRVVCNATRAGIALHIDNPLLYKNPPIMAPNGSTFVDTDGATRKVMEEQPLVAIKEFICQTIESQN